MEGWRDGARHNYTIPGYDLEQKWNIVDKYSIVSALNNEYHRKNVQILEDIIYSNPLCVHYFVSHVIICNWNSMHSVRQTGGMYLCMDGRFAKG